MKTVRIKNDEFDRYEKLFEGFLNRNFHKVFALSLFLILRLPSVEAKIFANQIVFLVYI